jgi:hypothetical protein
MLNAVRLNLQPSLSRGGEQGVGIGAAMRTSDPLMVSLRTGEPLLSRPGMRASPFLWRPATDPLRDTAGVLTFAIDAAHAHAAVLGALFGKKQGQLESAMAETGAWIQRWRIANG